MGSEFTMQARRKWRSVRGLFKRLQMDCEGIEYSMEHFMHLDLISKYDEEYLSWGGQEKFNSPWQ
jgi:hypothetical protein